MVVLFFSLVPHKEERFLTQVYPSIVLGSALVLGTLIAHLNSLFSSKLAFLGKVIGVCCLVLYVLLSISRNAALVMNFSGHRRLLSGFNSYLNDNVEMKLINRDLNVCMGKDWYRFESSFLLPMLSKGVNIESSKNTEMFWIDANFTGLLPQPFGPFPSGLSTPTGSFNNENREEKVAYTSLDICDFVIDTVSSSDPLDIARRNGADFQTLFCFDILDLDHSDAPWRSFYIPLNAVSHHYTFADMCLFKSRTRLVL